MRYKQIKHLIKQSLAENEDLFEIRMSTANLRREAAKTGALAGMEFEMIVPNVQGDPGDFESEPDYDRDERCRSIEDAVQFFHDGDYNGRREVERLREKMQEDYLEWLDGKIESEWDNDGEEYIQEWVKNNVGEDEWNPDELEGDARNEAMEEFAANVHADPMGDYYQQARDEFREEHQEDWDESDWLDSEDLDSMSSIENAYNINWPYYTEPGDEYGQAEISDVARDFENAIGRDTWASSSYHSGATLRPSPTRIRYVVEPDGSLEGDNPGDQGLEFVSPPLPIDEILSDLNKVKAWAKEYGCYTNDSTGLHINISVPDYSREKLDFVKLALLMGDKYVLDLFGRSGNTYAQSAFDIIKRSIRENPENAQTLLDKMKGNLDQLATKAIHSGITKKYTSINTKDGHIEFRSPGGDWLDQNFDQIENTLLRFTVAMTAAMNPEMYRQEYLTKLYKLLNENNKDIDTIKYFSDYVAGKIPKAALRSFVKQAQLERRLKRDPTGGEKYWWRVSNPAQSFGEIEVVATTKEEAIEKALAPDGYPNWANTRQTIKAVPVRPYDTSPLKATVGEPRAIGQLSGATLNGRPSNPDGRYVIVPENDRNNVVYRFQAAGPDDANLVLRQWRVAHPGRIWLTLRDDNGVLGQPEEAESSLWAVRRISDDNAQPMGPTLTIRARDEQAARDQVRRDYPEYEFAWLDVQPAETNTVPEVPMDVAQNFPDRTDGRNVDYSFGDLFGTNRTAQINYELYNRLTDQVIDTFPARNDQEALTRLSDYRQFGAGQSSPDHFGVRRGPGVDNTAPTTSQPPAQPAQQQNTPPATTTGQFTGEWRVLDPRGREIYRFSGVGNNQSDANRVALDWMRRNPRHLQTGVEVLPVMS